MTPVSEAGTSVEVKPEELAECPFCRSDVVAVGRLFHPSHPATPFQASCGHCGACGSEAATIALAAESWNAVAALIQPTPAETAPARITPFSDGGKIEDRIDEAFASGVTVHIEMLGEDNAWMQIGDDVFTIYAKRGKLFIAWRDNESDLTRRSALEASK